MCGVVLLCDRNVWSSSTVRQKCASETEGDGLQTSDQASIWGRNMGYDEETRIMD